MMVRWLREKRLRTSNFFFEQTQPRVSTGATGEQSVAQWLQSNYDLEIQNVVHVGSRMVDIRAALNGTLLNFEVKSVSGPIARVAVYDARVHRSRDIRGTSKKDPVITRFVRDLTNGQHNDFVQWIDALREEDISIGFPGDAGVRQRSGSLPKGRTVSKRTGADMRKYQRLVLRRLEEKNVHYFVFCYSGQPHIYHTSGSNPLNASRLPYPVAIMLDTYGQPGNNFPYGQMRLALKATFKV